MLSLQTSASWCVLPYAAFCSCACRCLPFDACCYTYPPATIWISCLQGRFSFVGAQPALEVVAKGQTVTVLDHAHGTRSVQHEADPMQVGAKNHTLFHTT